MSYHHAAVLVVDGHPVYVILDEDSILVRTYMGTACADTKLVYKDAESCQKAFFDGDWSILARATINVSL
tara:strand:+ start:2181 stop:2390 length:210 start_codon:yes stop_codon:yes gene_type:complete